MKKNTAENTAESNGRADDNKRSGVVTGARIILALERGTCEPTVSGVAAELEISPNSARKAMTRLVAANILRETGPHPRPGTPPTKQYHVKPETAREVA